MFVVRPLIYPMDPHVRRHGPLGYVDAKHFKPWLRDEFRFRCVYCLVRERWHPDGDNGFGVEHLRPKAMDPSRIVDYENLVYACCRCNAAKQDLEGILNPVSDPFGSHLLVSDDGVIHGLSDAGNELIKVCQLDRARLTEFRRGIFQILHLIQSNPLPERRALLTRVFGFPVNLPRLSTLRPPRGNLRPFGVESSWYEVASRGELPEVY